jgi:hypothetical protein
MVFHTQRRTPAVEDVAFFFGVSIDVMKVVRLLLIMLFTAWISGAFFCFIATMVLLALLTPRCIRILV